MESWSDRLKKWMKEAGHNVPDLERLSGVSRESLYKYLKGRTAAPRGDILTRLAKVFGKTAAELEYGLAASAPQSVARIPLLRGTDLDTLTSIDTLVSGWQGESVTVPSSMASDGVFALVIEDQANSPHISMGDFVIVSPHASANPGDFVVAKVDRLGRGVCRKYRPTDAMNGNQFVLAASNQDYPDIHVDEQNPGVVIGRAIGVFKTL